MSSKTLNRPCVWLVGKKNSEKALKKLDKLIKNIYFMRFEDLTLAFQALFPMQQKEQSWFLVLNVFSL